MRRETGKEYGVKVHSDEGIASHIGPEPCAGIREGAGEASVGEHIGQPLSHEILVIPDADAVEIAEGNTNGRVYCELPNDPAWSETLACMENSLHGNREISGLAIRSKFRGGWSASGRRGAVADDARSREV